MKRPLPNLSTLPAHSAKKWVRRGAMSLKAALDKAQAESDEGKLFKDKK